MRTDGAEALCALSISSRSQEINYLFEKKVAVFEFFVKKDGSLHGDGFFLYLKEDMSVPDAFWCAYRFGDLPPERALQMYQAQQYAERHDPQYNFAKIGEDVTCGISCYCFVLPPAMPDEVQRFWQETFRQTWLHYNMRIVSLAMANGAAPDFREER